ncbi:MAG: hypothetical protein KBS91_02055, partial [Firmicutes bacterium]|nr:hypothetical protein [Candidatus Caballimonas caccae]
MENKKLLAIFLTCCITLFITFVSLDIVKADSSTVELVDSSTLDNGLLNDTQKQYIYYKSEFTSVKFESPYLNYYESLAMSISLPDYHYDVDRIYAYHLIDYDYFFKYEFDYRLVYSFSEWEVYINNLQVTELNDSTRPAGLKYGYLSFPIINNGFI